MKSTDGNLKKYTFKEVEDKPKNVELESRVNQLDQKLDKLLNALGEGERNESIIQTNGKQSNTEHTRER